MILHSNTDLYTIQLRDLNESQIPVLQIENMCSSHPILVINFMYTTQIYWSILYNNLILGKNYYVFIKTELSETYEWFLQFIVIIEAFKNVLLHTIQIVFISCNLHVTGKSSSTAAAAFINPTYDADEPDAGGTYRSAVS